MYCIQSSILFSDVRHVFPYYYLSFSHFVSCILSVLLSVSACLPLAFTCPLQVPLLRMDNIFAQHDKLKNLLEQENVIFICHGTINKVASDPCLFIRNSSASFGGHQSCCPGFAWSLWIFTNSHLGYKWAEQLLN